MILEMGKNKNMESGTEALQPTRFQIPGRKMDTKVWNRFKTSEDWKSAPCVFDPYYQRETDLMKVAEPSDAVNGAADRSDMQTGADYYSVRMTSARKIFADEIDKEILIHAMAGESVRFQYDITDFIVLDDDVRMILRKAGRCDLAFGPADETQACDLLRDLAGSIRRKYLECLPQKRKGRGHDLEKAVISRLGTCEDALRECCRIHYLPVQSGIIRTAEDMKRYWFSGYVTLHGIYYWNCVRPDSFLMELADSPLAALRRYERVHRDYSRLLGA